MSIFYAIKYNCVYVIAHLTSWTEPFFKKRCKLMLVHKRDDDIIILLYFTFTLPRKSLKTGTKPCICAFTSKKKKKKSKHLITLK